MPPKATLFLTPNAWPTNTPEFPLPTVHQNAQGPAGYLIALSSVCLFLCLPLVPSVSSFFVSFSAYAQVSSLTGCVAPLTLAFALRPPRSIWPCAFRFLLILPKPWTWACSGPRPNLPSPIKLSGRSITSTLCLPGSSCCLLVPMTTPTPNHHLIPPLLSTGRASWGLSWCSGLLCLAACLGGLGAFPPGVGPSLGPAVLLCSSLTCWLPVSWSLPASWGPTLIMGRLLNAPGILSLTPVCHLQEFQPPQRWTSRSTPIP
ncbi:hypothetical protein DSO57_1033657 [Entomophthora muscae]|uniref:Uncharacterized protein n=1 Tax=Entomophthora muscae TaxID=34485 RepID=A0ACC2RR15_9FUNG|nr:hypothetical protein DSO57_1033657 [Entomophthora muscae]